MGNDEYIVCCWHCGAAFNAFEVPFCTHMDATKICPFCLKCSCDAPEEYKKKFTENCPKKLLEEKISQQEGKELKLGEILIKAGKISEDQLNIAIERQKIEKRPLGEIFMMMGIITYNELEMVLVDQRELAFINLDKFELDFPLVEKVGKKFCLHYKFVPLEYVKMNNQKILRFAIGDKADLYRLKLVKGLKDIVLVPYLADKKKIELLLEEIRDQDLLVLK
jgi:hypothetical protein